MEDLSPLIRKDASLNLEPDDEMYKVDHYVTINCQRMKEGDHIKLEPNSVVEHAHFGVIQAILTTPNGDIRVAYFSCKSASTDFNTGIENLPTIKLSKDVEDRVLYLVPDSLVRYKVRVYDWNESSFMIIHHDYFN